MDGALDAGCSTEDTNSHTSVLTPAFTPARARDVRVQKQTVRQLAGAEVQPLLPAPLRPPTTQEMPEGRRAVQPGDILCHSAGRETAVQGQTNTFHESVSKKL